MKDDQFKNDAIGSEGAIKQPEMILVDEDMIRKMEMARLEKKAAKKKKKMAREEEKKTKEEMRTVKEEHDLEKFRIVLERLQLNWIKWNVTCIAIGFAAYKFYYGRIQDEKSPINYIINGRDIGLFLISIGSLALIFATIQHNKNVEKLKNRYENMPYSLSLRLAYIIIPFAIFILVLVILRT